MDPDSADDHDDHESESMDDASDDEQLTIRIPNPKHYMARQSQWKGRRGKPRCDHCRMNNLKCDRMLPSCNHCSWANGRECKYTPLPTPAHRGIPRCDRCRQRNLKCDRSLPVCNNCQEEEQRECNYTPKKRHKVPLEHGLSRDRFLGPYGQKTAAFLVSEPPPSDDLLMLDSDSDDNSGGHTFYGQNVASPSPSRGRKRGMRGGASPSTRGEGSRPMSGRFSSDTMRPWPQHPPPLQLAPKFPTQAKHLSFITHSFPSEQGLMTSISHVDPWTHPGFAPLPDSVLEQIAKVDSIEMPDRNAFDAAVSNLLVQMEGELRDTAVIEPEVYAALAQGVAKNDFNGMPERLHAWSMIHHLRSGSSKFHLLILPREPYFQISREEERKLRKEFIAQIDGRFFKGKEPDREGQAGESTTAFERVPVQPQIYDVLVYGHRSHGPATTMLIDIRRAGIATITFPMAELFVRLCPLCNLRHKSSGSSHASKAEATSSSTLGPSTVPSLAPVSLSAPPASSTNVFDAFVR